MRRTPWALVTVAALSAACAQLLGIDTVHDDPADGGNAPVDAAGGIETGTDAAHDARPPVDASTDGGATLDAAPDTAPTTDPALLGCTSPDGAPVEFFQVASPSGLALDDSNVYIADNGGIRRCAVEGCAAGPTSITTTSPRDFGVNASHVVYTDNKSLLVRDLNNNPVRGVLSWGAQLVALDGLDIYWTQGPVLRHTVDADDAATPIIYNDPDTPIAVAANSQFAYFIDYGADASAVGHLMGCPAPECAGGPKLFAEVASVDPVQKVYPTVVATEGGVYWSDPSAGEIRACDVTGCESGVRSVVTGVVAVDIFIDHSTLYWSISSGPDDLDAGIARQPLDGGASDLLAGHLARVNRVVANASCVYWTETPLPTLGGGYARAMPLRP